MKLVNLNVRKPEAKRPSIWAFITQRYSGINTSEACICWLMGDRRPHHLWPVSVTVKSLSPVAYDQAIQVVIILMATICTLWLFEQTPCEPMARLRISPPKPTKYTETQSRIGPLHPPKSLASYCSFMKYVQIAPDIHDMLIFLTALFLCWGSVLVLFGAIRLWGSLS